ncbi:MAG: META domain-containing protein, partial [Pseudomonadota bacterium]
MLRWAAALALLPSMALAVGDGHGPDHWMVTDVAADDVLNVRAGPSARSIKIGEYPPDLDGLTNHGCIGYLSFDEFQVATEAEREAARKRVWCVVGSKRYLGWVAGRFLVEGDRTEQSPEWLFDLSGTEWNVILLGGAEPKARAWVTFRSPNQLFGNAGCNQFNGTYRKTHDQITVEPLSTTRKACPPAET